MELTKNLKNIKVSAIGPLSENHLNICFIGQFSVGHRCHKKLKNDLAKLIYNWPKNLITSKHSSWPWDSVFSIGILIVPLGLRFPFWPRQTKKDWIGLSIREMDWLVIWPICTNGQIGHCAYIRHFLIIFHNLLPFKMRIFFYEINKSS